MNKPLSIIALMLIVVLTYSCDANKNKANTQGASAVSTDNTAPMQKKVFDTDYIMQCALEGNIEPVKGALENGFDPNSTNIDKRTPLMLAAYNGHTEIVSLLIDKGAEVNKIDTIHRTALMYASTGPFVPTVVKLLEAGAKPNLVDGEENWTAVMMAAAEGQLEVVKTLVEYGADLKMVDVDGESSLDFANSKGHTEVVNYIKSQLK